MTTSPIRASKDTLPSNLSKSAFTPPNRMNSGGGAIQMQNIEAYVTPTP